MSNQKLGLLKMDQGILIAGPSDCRTVRAELACQGEAVMGDAGPNVARRQKSDTLPFLCYIPLM